MHNFAYTEEMLQGRSVENTKQTLESHGKSAHTEKERTQKDIHRFFQKVNAIRKYEQRVYSKKLTTKLTFSGKKQRTG